MAWGNSQSESHRSISIPHDFVEEEEREGQGGRQEEGDEAQVHVRFASSVGSSGRRRAITPPSPEMSSSPEFVFTPDSTTPFISKTISKKGELELDQDQHAFPTKAKSEGYIQKQIYALLQKSFMIKCKRVKSVFVTLLEILVPVIFFLLLSLRAIVSSSDCSSDEAVDFTSPVNFTHGNDTSLAANHSAGNTTFSAEVSSCDSQSLLSFNQEKATVGLPFPIEDIRWTTSSNASETVNFCAFAGGAGHSQDDIMSMFTGETATPKLSPAYKVLYAPNNTQHEQLARQAAKSLLCSRSQNEAYNWQLKGLNALTGGGLVPEAVLNSVPMGPIFTLNRTHTFMEIVSACNYLNQIFNKCILTQTEFEDEFFENLFGDNKEGTKKSSGSSGDKILDIISGFIQENTDQTIEVLTCINGITSTNVPRLELLDTIVTENPCDPTCLEDESCISDVLDLFLFGFGSEDEAIEYVYENPADVMGLIAFEDGQKGANNSETFRYKVRVNGTDIAPASKPFLQWQGAGNDFPFSFWKGYYTFVNLQSSIDKAVASWVNPDSISNSTGMNDVLLSPYPTKIFSVVSVEQLAYFALGVIFVVAFLPSVILQLYSIVFEKQTHLQDFQFIMGLRPWVYWAVHFFVSYIPQIFIAIGISLIAGNVWKYGALKYSDVSTLIVFFLLWQASLTSYVGFLSSFFTKTTVACISGTLLYMLSCLPGIIVTFVHPGGNISWLLVSVFPASLVWIFAQVLLQMENVKIGVKWDTLTTSLYSFDSINVQVLMIIAVADTVFYLLLLCFWKDVIFVWLKNLYLLFVGRAVCEPKMGDTKYDSKSTISQFEEEHDTYCQELETLEMASVQITDLRKVFDKGRTVAVKGLNLDMYEGEVTSLLGSNGAGKTTTISILTGRLSASGGDARILGRSILRDLSLIRRAMGVCTQHDSLWPLISVKEHMVFFSHVKGLPQREILPDIEKILRRLKLLHQIHTLSGNLSGGQRRKLSLALAVLGDPYFILLDEPSTGMDPKSRRDTWQFIKEAKEGRVILLTTHFMDEAEELGDKIAIMSSGKLRCWGTPSYLRNVLEIGYQLRFLCESVAERDQANDGINEIVNKYVSGAKSQPMAGTELKILIPENERKHFPGLLRAIESSKDQLNIESFGLTCTTMEDIFLQVVQMSDEELLDKQKRKPDSVKSDLYEDKHSQIWHKHIPVLLWKRFLNAKRDIIGLTTQVAAFVVLLVLGLGLLKKSLIQDIPETQSAVKLSAEDYLHAPPGFIPVAQNSFSGNLEFENLQELYAEDFDLSYNATNMGQNKFQKELARNITDQRISCDKAPFQSCSALYYADAVDAVESDSRDALDYTLFFSQSAFHSPAASLNLFDSYILRKDNDGNKNLTLEVLNQPLPLVGVQRRGNIQAFIQVSNLSFIFLILAVALLASSFCTYVTYEKRFQANMLQILSGTSTLTYHVSNYIWSFSYFLLVYGCIVVILFAMPTRPLYFFSENAVSGTLLLFFLFGPASIGLGFLLQRPFRNDMISYGAILGINTLVGLLMFELVLIMVGLSFPVFDKSSVPMHVLSVVEWVFPLNPVYALIRGFFEITWFSFYAQYPITCTNLFKCSVYSPFSMGNSLVTRNLIFLGAESIAFICFFFALELKVFSFLGPWKTKKKRKDLLPDYIDEDVDDERRRVMGSDDSKSINSLQDAAARRSNGEDLVLIKNLWVMYGDRAAIKGLSFGLKEGKCFGLLGMNGAGKTSFFKVLTGANKATHGEVLVRKDGETIDLLNDKIKKNRLVGYCPQSDALLPRLTVLEQLQLYGVIKGLEKDSLPAEITTLLTALGLTKYLNRQTGNLSGGNQRKVSVAIALLGQPALILLDEPSAGLDPEARRSLWNAITDSTQDKTVVLTSHSMEECEALCDYIALMSLGEFHAFGTIAHLKQRFGKGYCLLLYVKDGKMMAVLNFLETVEWLDIDEVCGCEIRIRIDASIDIAWVFEQVEEVVCTEDIIDYSISPTTLEEVFLGFAGGLLRSNFVCRSQLAASGVVNGLLKKRLHTLQNQSQKSKQGSIGRSITFCEDLLESPAKLKSNRLSLP